MRPSLLSLSLSLSLSLALCACGAPHLTGTGSSDDGGVTDAGGAVDAGPSDAGALVCASCPAYQSRSANLGVISVPALREISGLAVSRAHPGVLYAHNDSGGQPTVYAFSTTGASLGDFTLTGALNRDWERPVLGLSLHRAEPRGRLTRGLADGDFREARPAVSQR